MSVYKLFIARHTWKIVFLMAAITAPEIKAASMTITNLFPANNAVEVCADTKLWITFGTTPIVATSGNLQICKVSDNTVIYQLTLQTLPSDAYGHISTGWPAAYKITLNGRTVNYEPFAVDGNTVEIWPNVRLEYNTSYYVKMTAGFCSDAGGNTSPEVNDTSTWRFTTKAAAPVNDHEFIVALDGSGDFCTIQGAVDAVADSDPTRTVVKIRKGTYREIINIPSGKKKMTWLGEDRDATIVEAFNCEGFNTGSDARMLVRAGADEFRMYNMTFHNLRPDGGSGAQAETVKQAALRTIAEKCTFKSYQDTLCLNGQMYVNDCYIEGDVDYIWGYGTVYFDHCEIRCLNTQSYVVQPRQANGANGFFIVDCNLTWPRRLTSCYLGRGGGASYPYGQTAYINCTMPSILFYQVGWLLNGTDPTNLRFWEYKSRDQAGYLIDTSLRLSPGSRQLSDAEAITWRDVNNVFSQNPWNPKNLDEFPTASWQPGPNDGATGVNPLGTTLTWASGAAAISHVIYLGTSNPPEYTIEQTGTSYNTGAMTPGTAYYWRVDEKNAAGTTTGIVWSFTTFPYICGSSIASDLSGDCEINFLDYVRIADAWAGNLPQVDITGDGILNFMDIQQFALDWLSCNREPATECWQ